MVAVIGGSGFIGSRLCQLLKEAEVRFRILDIQPSPFFPDAWARVDILDRKALIEGLRGCDSVVHLAAQHRDNVRPLSLYHDVNVTGTENVTWAAEALGIQKIVFTSSVAVYGFAPRETDESGTIAPFNDYGKTKFLAEEALRSWKSGSADRSLIIVRPTVVFGERNRGNVFNLLRQIASGRFVMVGKGANQKSMAYVGNVAAFLFHGVQNLSGDVLANYVDKPDLCTTDLVILVRQLMGKPAKIGLRLPYWFGYLGGAFLDLVAALTGRQFPISRIRVKKFVADTQFAAPRLEALGFQRRFTLEEGLSRTVRFEFLETNEGPTFLTE